MVNDLYFTFWETIATILVNKLTLGKEEKTRIQFDKEILHTIRVPILCSVDDPNGTFYPDGESV